MKPEIILLGGGGHCRSCIDVIEQAGDFNIAGIVDKNLSTENLFGYPILGTDDDLPQLRKIYNYAFITLGHMNNVEVRIQLYNLLKYNKFILPIIVSPRAYISEHSTLGAGTIVMHDVLINSGVVVGNNCIINTKALIEHDVVVQDNCHISTGAIINGSAVIKNATFIGSNSVIKELVSTKEKDFIKAMSLFVGQKDE